MLVKARGSLVWPIHRWGCLHSRIGGKIKIRSAETNKNCQYHQFDRTPCFSHGIWDSLDIFLEHRHQCAFDVHIGRFRASLALPPAQRPHPALLDAMYLIACYHSQVPELAILESHFLQRSLSGIFSSLQHSDRLIQVVQASSLLAVYFFSRGRVIEGYYHSSTAARLAVSLGLHQIKSEGWYHLRLDVMAQPVSFLSFKSSLRLTAPNDATEYAERVAAFWQVFVVDRAWSVACGLPAALPDDDSPRAQIETTLPSAIGDSPVCHLPLILFRLLKYLRSRILRRVSTGCNISMRIN